MMSQESNNSLMQQLKSHYNLSFDLFSSESAFFFEGAQRQHNLETLRHLSSFGDMVLFLTGEKGSGKTTLLTTLKKASFEGLNVIYLDVGQHTNNASSYTVFAECARALSLDIKASLTPSDILTSLLKECHRLVASDGKRTVFTFDNADKLSKKDLQVFFSFCRELPSESALVMLFSGSNALLQWSKQNSNLEQASWCHQIQLKPLSKIDVRHYLEQALSAAQSTEKLELSDSQLQQLSELGKGLPGRINKLFPSVILEPGLLKMKPRKKKAALPTHVLFGIAGLLVASFVFVSYQHGILDRIIPVFSLEDSAEGPAEVVSAYEEKERNQLEEKDYSQHDRLAMLDSVLKEKGIFLPKVVVENPSDSDFEGEEQIDVGGVEQASINSSLLVKADSESRDVIIKEPFGQQTELADASPLKANIAEADESASRPLQELAETSLQLNDKLIEKRHDSFKSRSWLAGQPVSSYMPQILGSYEEQTAQKFIKKIGMQKFEIYYLETEHKGKPWYVVFYGLFPAKTHAQDAVKNAPKVIRSQNPWIRKAPSVLASYPRK